MKTWVAILLFLSFSGSTAFAGNGFKNIEFGTTYEDAEKTIKTEYEKDKAGFSCQYCGYRVNYYENTYEPSITYWSYDLGELSGANITLRFDREHKQFYSYRIDANSSNANYIGHVFKEAKYLAKLLEPKYGKPSFLSKEPNIFNLRQGYYFYTHKWKNKDYDIYVEINTSDLKYNASASVGVKSVIDAIEKTDKAKKAQKTKEAEKLF